MKIITLKKTTWMEKKIVLETANDVFFFSISIQVPIFLITANNKRRFFKKKPNNQKLGRCYLRKLLSDYYANCLNRTGKEHCYEGTPIYVYQVSTLGARSYYLKSVLRPT
jgi:hypothetical protein